MNKESKIYVAGHRGLVGSAISKKLGERGYQNVVYRTHSELDLTDQHAVSLFFEREKPEYVFLAAAKVGGIMANNKYRADFMYQNLQIQNNVIHQSCQYGVKKLLFLGSTCIYPKKAPQPMSEDSLLTSELEYTNEPYAIAKIAGLKMCESYNIQYGTNFISVMPTNLYGPNDNFDLEKSHVLPALVRKFHLAKLYQNNEMDAILEDLEVDNSEDAVSILEKNGISTQSVNIWGSGKPMRELLYSEDMADACIFIMEKVDFNDLQKNKREIRNTHINIGTGEDISIADLAQLVKQIVQYNGTILFDRDKPDGTMKKCTDVSVLHSLGWKHTTDLQDGIQKLYRSYLDKKNR